MTDKTDNRLDREAGEREAWRAAFDERHEFDVYPEHFMSGMRNEFCAGWHAALKTTASQPKALTPEQAEAVEKAVGFLWALGQKQSAMTLRALLEAPK